MYKFTNDDRSIASKSLMAVNPTLPWRPAARHRTGVSEVKTGSVALTCRKCEAGRAFNKSCC